MIVNIIYQSLSKFVTYIKSFYINILYLTFTHFIVFSIIICGPFFKYIINFQILLSKIKNCI